MPKIIKSIYKGRVVDLKIERHRLPKGNIHDFEVVRHVPAAAVLPVHGDHLLLLKQYRAPLAKVIWEIPAGLIEKGETSLACVRREMIEETGYQGKKYKKLTSIYTGAGFCDEVITLYQCELGKHVGTDHEGSEDISVHLLPIDRVKRMLTQGTIKDAKTLVALQYYLASCLLNS
jgi:ADP-ribose pyrophosphatase